MVSVGTIVWLSSELMFFAGLFAIYFTARAQAAGNWPPPPTELNLYQAVPVTLVLIASSFTCQMGVFAAERGDVFGLRRWYLVTFAMGLFFVLGQGYEYHHLVSHGTTIPGSAYGSVFYLATGFHGLHVIGGLIAFIFLLARTTMSKFTPAQATAVDRRLLLLALRRHRLDRTVRHDLFHPMTSMRKNRSARLKKLGFEPIS